MSPYVYGDISKNEENKVYVFGSHQYALYYWTKAVSENKLGLKALLIHIDLHSDYHDPASCIDNQISLDPEAVLKCIKNRAIHYDDFIIPALKMGIVGDIAFCCNPKQRDNQCDNFKNYESPTKIAESLSRYNNGKSLSESEYSLCKKILEQNCILDIDLDFFLDFKCNSANELVLKQDKTILNEINAINTLFDFASITTITTSHDLGWDKERHYVQKIFSQHFKGHINFKNKPKVF